MGRMGNVGAKRCVRAVFLLPTEENSLPNCCCTHSAGLREAFQTRVSPSSRALLAGSRNTEPTTSVLNSTADAIQITRNERG